MASKELKVLLPQVMRRKLRKRRMRRTRRRSWRAKKTKAQTRRSTIAFWRNCSGAKMRSCIGRTW